MKIVFRVDASIHIGTGHVMRCLSLAQFLKKNGADCYFICREHNGNLIQKIQTQGYVAYRLPHNDQVPVSTKVDYRMHANWLGVSQEEDAVLCVSILNELVPNWVIVDHYALDATWECTVRASCQKLMVIDDLADRVHACDLLLDQTLGRNKKDYQLLVPDACALLCGAEYALLRPEFSQWREYSLRRRHHNAFEKLLIAMGGIDQNNMTGKVLHALKSIELPFNLKIIVVMGASAPWLENVRQIAGCMPRETQVLVDVNNMAEIMANSDLAIGAVGTTNLERMCLGLPSIALSIAANQVELCEFLSKKGYVNYVGTSELVDMEDIKNAIFNIIGQADMLTSQSKKIAFIVDGLGVDRVNDIIFAEGYIKNDTNPAER